MKLLITLAFRNILRNRRRTLITSLTVAISVGMLILGNSYFYGFLSAFYDDLIRLSGHLKIQHPEYVIKERMLSLHATVDTYESIVSMIDSIPEVKTASGRLKFGAILYYREENQPGMGIGINPHREASGVNISGALVEGHNFTGSPNETIIGTELANQLSLNVGDTLTILSKTPSGAMTGVNARIIGIVSLLQGNLNRIFFLPIKTVQNMLDMQGEVTEIAVFLQQSKTLDKVAKALRSHPALRDRFQVLTWAQAGGVEGILPMIKTFMIVIEFLFIFIAMLGIINTILMSVMERMREIGVMGAIGMKPWKILILFVLEGAFIGLCGGVIGVPIGSGLGYYLETFGITLGKVVQDFPFPIRQVIYGDLTYNIVIQSFLLGIAASMIAAILPAIKAARMIPTKALRSY